MILSQVKKIFIKLVPNVTDELILATLDGEVIDSNSYDLIGTNIVIDESKKFVFYISQYDTPKYAIIYSGSKEIFNMISLLFDEHKQTMTKFDFYREMILGHIKKNDFPELIKKFEVKLLDEYRIIIVKINREDLKKTKLLIENLVVFEESILIDNKTIAIVTSKSTDDIFELAKVLFAAISMELSIKPTISVGSVVDNLFDISLSFEDANKNIILSERFNIDKDVYYYEDLLVPMIIDNIPRELISEFNKKSFRKYKEIFESKELVFTAKNYFSNNLNITETSKKIFIHRNTLIYRINKIKEISGFDLKNFDEALKFYIILLIKDMRE